MQVERYVVDLPEYPALSKAASARLVEEVIKMTAEANVGLDRELLVSISREYQITLKDIEMFIDRFLTILYNNRLFSHLNKVTNPLSNVDVEISHRSALVEIAWNDRANKNHS